MHAADAQKIGVVFPSKIMNESPQRAQMIKTLELEFKDRITALQSLGKSIKDLEGKMKRDAELLSNKEKTDLQRQYQVKVSEFKLNRKALEEDNRRRQTEEQRKINATIIAVVNEVAKEDGYDLILNAEQVVFAKPEFDSLGKYEVKDGDLYELGRKLKYPLSWENDTAIITHAYTESYFDFSEFQVLRQDNNRLFLNYSDNDGLWRVEILSLKDDILTWYMIPVNEGSLKNMSQIIETIEEVEKQNMLTADGEIIGYNDTTIIAKDVKKRDFKTMIKNDMLKEISRFKRVDH